MGNVQRLSERSRVYEKLETGEFDNYQLTPYIWCMRILKSTKEIRDIVNMSNKKFKENLPDYCYVYLHKINDIVFYVGTGSHDRAVRIPGRSSLWYKTVAGEKVTVEIPVYNLTRDEGEKTEKEYIKQYSTTVINQQFTSYNLIPVLQFSRDGKLIKEYPSLISTENDGFWSTNISECCKGVRGLHNNFVWMYKDDYEKNGFRAKIGLTHPKIIEQIDKQGNSVRKLTGSSAFEKYGFSASNVQQVCRGGKKSHLGFKFKYVDN